MRHPAGETVTVTRQGEPTGEDDELGNPIIGPDTTFTVSDVAVAPAGTEEDPQALGLWVTTGLTLYVPYGVEFRATDRVTVNGEEWQVVGGTNGPGDKNPFTGATPGNVVSVKRGA